MSLHNIANFPRLELLGSPTPLEHLPRLSDYLGRDIFIKRDDVTPVALGVTNSESWSFSPLMRCVPGLTFC
ncbi:hypothetical protein ERHA55_31670 [Erwinia rhapontici]|nr:hypothetical protein ERHA55_31670 [Erwinia rhapontici]